jgi:hypothetical protein
MATYNQEKEAVAAYEILVYIYQTTWHITRLIARP